jgi:hypothetical protein
VPDRRIQAVPRYLHPLPRPLAWKRLLLGGETRHVLTHGNMVLVLR